MGVIILALALAQRPDEVIEIEGEKPVERFL
jgi:hypothetical protein